MATVKFILRLVCVLGLASLLVLALTQEIPILKNDTTAEDFKALHEEIADVVDEEGGFHIENVPSEVNPVLEVNKAGNKIVFSKGNAQVTFVFSPSDGHVTDMFEISTREDAVEEAKIAIGFASATLLIMVMVLIAIVGSYIEEVRRYSKNKR